MSSIPYTPSSQRSCFLSRICLIPRIWIHERHIYKAIGVPKSEYFGQWLSFPSSNHQPSHAGDKRLGTRIAVDAEYASCNFSITSGTNAHNVAFVSFEQMESFNVGDFNIGRD
jgi:hypothetical protein